MVSVIESVLEDPRPVIAAQINKARGEAVAQMKADGLDYEERMAELESVTNPKPLAELLEPMFEVYRESHPWVADFELRPKSVVRDLCERAMDFGDYVRHYQLARVEGTVLRYLTDAYRTLVKTVPEDAKTDALLDLTEWLGEIVRQVDSSLLDEWEELRAPVDAAADASGIEAPPPPVTANRRAFTVLVRNALFHRVELAAARQWGALGDLDADDGWTMEAWYEALAPFLAEHGEGAIGIGPDARSPALLVIDEQPGRWAVRQILDDPERHHDWSITAEVDLAASDDAGTALVHITGVGPT